MTTTARAPNSQKHIAIVGAGIAGLSCATALQQSFRDAKADVSITVFDKSRGVAGRMSTRRVDDWQCDHGAQYFTARDPAFRAEVARWQEAGVAALWRPTIKVFDGDSGRASNAASELERFVGTPRMTAPAQWLATSLSVRTQTTIVGLHALSQSQDESQRWQLQSTEHGLIDTHWDAVVLAIPAPQAIQLLPSSTPALTTFARSANMRACWALMLRFAHPTALPFDAAFVNTGPLRWIARNDSKPGRNAAAGETWLLHANAEWSQAHLEDSPEDVASALIEAFRALGGTAPDSWSAHRWRYADTEPPLSAGCAWDASKRIGLCGDWLNGGKVEGAWRSGQALAADLVRSFSVA